MNGSLGGLKTKIVFDEAHLDASSLWASVDVSTIETGIDLRNKDLREKKEWFDEAKYPVISFQSKKIEKTSTGYIVTGDLTLKAATKPVKIPFTFSSTGASGVFKGQFTLNCDDYELGKSKFVKKAVEVNIVVPVSK